MASEGTDLSTRMSSEDQSTDSFMYNIIFRHFKRHKVEISRAIKKEFPFLEILRDRELITNKMYEDCQESCRNLVPVQRVVYNVLEELEKTFDLPLLEALFSEANKQEYPDLNNIYKSFEKAIHENICFHENDGEESVEDPNTQLSLEQGTSPSENGLSEHHCERGQINVNETVTTSNNSDALESQQVNERCAQETDSAGAELPNHGIQINSCSVHLVDIKKEKPFFNPNVEKETQTSDIIVISSDEDESPKASTSEQRRGPESNEEGEIQEATCSAPEIAPQPLALRKSPTCRKRLWENGKSHEESYESSADEMPPEIRSFTVRRDPDEEDSPDIANQSTWKMSNKKRWISSGDSSELNNGEEPQETSSSTLRNGSVRSRGRDRIQSLNNRVPRKRSKPKETKAVNTRPLKRSRKRGPRIPRDKHINFKLPILPVTCGPANGMLYKEKMKQGISAKCIKTTNGKQLTLKEFEIEGNHIRSKNWRMSVRCGGYPLKCLIQKGFLSDPPRRRNIIPESHGDNITDPYPENSNICAVCHKEGTLFCCDTCSKSFHETCHIQHIDPDRNPWSCIFCQIKVIQESCPESQPCHQESEILEKEMLHEERLKCELLLLKVCGWSKSSFFIPKPYYSKNPPQSLKKCMWLNKIREKLASKLYLKVKEFVQDMRLIFQNHRSIYKGQKFIMLGSQVQDKFENNFKEIFGIQ